MPLIDSEVIQQYNDDGVAVIRGCISDHWLGVLNEAIEHDIRDPARLFTPISRNLGEVDFTVTYVCGNLRRGSRIFVSTHLYLSWRRKFLHQKR